MRSLRRWAALFFFVGAACAQDAALFKQIGGISEELERITGLRLKHPVPYDYITKANINAFLKKRMKEVAKPEEIRAEEVTLKKFGLAPPEFDLAKNTVDLLTEQAAAFYDYNAKKLFITETTPEDNQQTALVHELSHALADQSFNLARYIRKGAKNDDGALARMAVMEGQASWLMSEYLAQQKGQSLTTSPALARAMADATETGAGGYPIYEGTPLYLQRQLIFPYTQGLMFQQAVAVKEGKAGFGLVFRKAPVSTQQILHPEKYFEGVVPTQPALPAVKLPRGFKELVGGTLGEFDLAVLIEQFAGKVKAASLAPHWRGGQFDLRERRGDRIVLLFSVQWDGEPAARDFLSFYRTALRKKWKKMSVASESPDEFAGTGDDGWFRVRRAGTVVTSLEGFEAALN